MRKLSRFGTAGSLLALGALLIFVYQNCGIPGAGMSPDLSASLNEKVTAEDLSRLTSSIKTLNDLDRSCVSDDQCGTLALGAKSCGGPREYLVVSSRNGSLDKITAMAQQLQVAENIYNQENQVISNCMMMVEPEVRCLASSCQAVN